MSTTTRMTLSLRPFSPGRLPRGLLIAALLSLAAVEVVAFYHLWPSDDGVSIFETEVTHLPGALIHEPETITARGESLLPAPVMLSLLGGGMIGFGLYRRHAAA